jgi:hypothetical protein
MRLPILLIIASCAGSVAASEIHPVDIRLSLVVAPPTSKVEASYRFPDNSGGTFTENELHPGARFEAGLATSLATISERWSLVGGGMIFYGNQESSDSDPGDRDIGMMAGPMEMTTLGVDLFIALNVRFNPYFGAEAGPFVGLGTASIYDHAQNIQGGIDEQGGHGDYEEAGFNLAFFVHNATRSAIFALGVRYYAAYTEADLQYDVVRTSDMQEFPNGLTQHIEITQRGFAPYLTVGMTF